MLAALLLAGIVAAPLGSIALLLPLRARRGRPGAWSTTRRFLLALIGTVVLIALVAGVLELVGLPATRQWSARAHLCWASSVFLFVVYLAYALDWTFASHLGAASTAGGVLLWVFELLAAVMSDRK